MKLLIVEDNEQELKSFRDNLEDYKRDNDHKEHIKLIECRAFEEALEVLDNSFDGAIIDLKLAHEGNEGNQIVDKIVKSFFRIPIAIFTGLPYNWDDTLNEKIMFLGLFIKGETGYDEILDQFWNIYNTGLTRIVGSRGLIEKTLVEIFRKIFQQQKQKEKWIAYGRENPEQTEKALLRYTLNHLFQLLEENGECFPEEFYLSPLEPGRITTGSIVKSETTDRLFVVLSPACDLVTRKNGKINTDHILLVQIENVDSVLGGSKSKGKVREICTNKRQYYHWLPETDFFHGGILNFRKLTTPDENEFHKNFENIEIQISPFFVKDIVSRFSSYYARQGQPDIDTTEFVNRYTT